MAVKIYVGNLPYKLSDSELKDLFGRFGMVESATIITDHHSGKSRGFAFVEMAKHSEACQAVRSLNGKEVLGRKLKVREAHSRKDKMSGPAGQSFHFGMRRGTRPGSLRRNF